MISEDAPAASASQTESTGVASGVTATGVAAALFSGVDPRKRRRRRNVRPSLGVAAPEVVAAVVGAATTASAALGRLSASETVSRVTTTRSKIASFSAVDGSWDRALRCGGDKCSEVNSVQDVCQVGDAFCGARRWQLTLPPLEARDDLEDEEGRGEEANVREGEGREARLVRHPCLQRRVLGPDSRPGAADGQLDAPAELLAAEPGAEGIKAGRTQHAAGLD